MKALATLLLFTLSVATCLGQGAENTTSGDEAYVYIFVNEKGKVILNGKKSGLQRLELYLEDTEKSKAKIGTVKPTPLAIFSKYEKVVMLCEKYGIKTEWYRDENFTTPFFEEEQRAGSLSLWQPTELTKIP